MAKTLFLFKDGLIPTNKGPMTSPVFSAMYTTVVVDAAQGQGIAIYFNSPTDRTIVAPSYQVFQKTPQCKTFLEYLKLYPEQEPPKALLLAQKLALQSREDD